MTSESKDFGTVFSNMATKGVVELLIDALFITA